VPIAAAGGTPVGNIFNNYAAFLNQGCLPGSLNQPAAYGVVNSNATFLATGNLFGLNNGTNVFADNPLQDTNLHDIASVAQPKFTSYEDLIEIHASYNISDSLTLTSITGFNRATGTSLEDYNRIVPDLPFTPTNNAFLGLFGVNANALFPNGVVNDPQIGTTNKFATFDYGTAESNEYTEELRLQSSFKGPVNFSAGLFYSEETSPLGSNNYFVFSNALTGAGYANNAVGGALLGGPIYTDPSQIPTGAGHNYYDARDGGGYLKTYAGFAEVYWQLTPTLKLTLGGRYNVDQLYNLSYPISVLVAVPNGTAIQTNGYPGNGGVGTTGYAGFPTSICTTSLSECLIPQGVTYREFTGRANLDWTPTLSFTDKTLVYASYSRGYKGGGFNTPCQTGLGTVGSVGNNCPYPLSYNPEFIDAFEVGTKNTLLGGSLTLDADAFYYNYNGYQISSIVDKSSVNLNINAKIYGAEFESVYSPIRNFTVNANIGYLHTRIDNNQFEVDTLNLTQGNPNYTLLHADDGTACLAPTNYLAALIAGGAPAPFLNSGVIPPSTTPAFAGACTAAGYATGNAIAGNANYVNFNNVNGVPVNLGGKQLPNSPNWTISLGAQYVFDLPDDWRATLRGDYYWQGQSWARVFNAVNDQLLAYHVVNATLTFAQSTNGLEVKLWVKNVFNAQPITGVYLTNDTSGLFQNVFTLDPRTYGVQLTKRF
jgi:outer membrane receptor protein involved in Fe transport